MALNIEYSDKGKRCGQTHPNAKLTNREVELLRRMHEDEGIGYRQLSRMFETPRSTVASLCKYRHR